MGALAVAGAREAGRTPQPARRWPLGGALVLAVLYAIGSLFVAPGGYLGADTGAKVATLDAMVDSGSWRPLVPYWADDLDPEGRVHPLYQSRRVEEGWVNVTTLPMLLAARPLYAVGGYHLALILPMAGAIGAALAARSLGRRVAGAAAGERAFWCVGLVSPVVVYALDLWEHSIGVACVLGAVALLAGLVDGSDRMARAAGAGVLLGIAATMRTESMVYAVVAVALCALALAAEGRWRTATYAGLASMAGFATPWLANRGLESVLGGTDRTARASGAASVGLGDVADRWHEALVTLLAPDARSGSSILVLGLVTVAFLLGAVHLDRRGRSDLAPVLVVAAVVLHAVFVLDGLGFVPGMLVAAPLAAVGLVVRPRSRPGAYGLAVAVAALPLVWAFQYLGGALPQWAGRYTLPSCILLVVLGAVALPSLGRPVRAGVLACAAIVTLSGVAWTVHRSHAVDSWFADASRRPEDVLIARNGFLPREGGPASAERRWLTATTEADLAFAVDVVARSGFGTFAVVDRSAEAAHLPGTVHLGTTTTGLVGTPLYVHSYELG